MGMIALRLMVCKASASSASAVSTSRLSIILPCSDTERAPSALSVDGKNFECGALHICWACLKPVYMGCAAVITW